MINLDYTYDVTRTWHLVVAANAAAAIEATLAQPHDTVEARQSIYRPPPGSPGPGSPVWALRCLRSHSRHLLPQFARIHGGWGVHLWSWHLSLRTYEWHDA